MFIFLLGPNPYIRWRKSALTRATTLLFPQPEELCKGIRKPFLYCRTTCPNKILSGKYAYLDLATLRNVGTMGKYTLFYLRTFNETTLWKSCYMKVYLAVKKGTGHEQVQFRVYSMRSKWHLSLENVLFVWTGIQIQTNLFPPMDWIQSLYLFISYM